MSVPEDIFRSICDKRSTEREKMTNFSTIPGFGMLSKETQVRIRQIVPERDEEEKEVTMAAVLIEAIGKLELPEGRELRLLEASLSTLLNRPHGCLSLDKLEDDLGFDIVSYPVQNSSGNDHEIKPIQIEFLVSGEELARMQTRPYNEYCNWRKAHSNNTDPAETRCLRFVIDQLRTLADSVSAPYGYDQDINSQASLVDLKATNSARNRRRRLDVASIPFFENLSATTQSLIRKIYSDVDDDESEDTECEEQDGGYDSASDCGHAGDLSVENKVKFASIVLRAIDESKLPPGRERRLLGASLSDLMDYWHGGVDVEPLDFYIVDYPFEKNAEGIRLIASFSEKDLEDGLNNLYELYCEEMKTSADSQNKSDALVAGIDNGHSYTDFVYMHRHALPSIGGKEPRSCIPGDGPQEHFVSVEEGESNDLKSRKRRASALLDIVEKHPRTE